MGKKTKDNIVAQAGILAVAGIISRIIGLLYRSPLTSVIGTAGNGYYQSAYAIYTIILLISSYSIPSAVSKIIASKLAVKEYRNAHRIFRCALVYVLIVGAIGSAVLFFGAELLAKQEGSIPAIKIFAPTVLIYGPLGVLRGYFQAHKSMVQTSVSQILEQIMNAVASIGFAYLFIKMFAGTDTKSIATWGAAGSAVGTGLGVVMGLIVMFLIYLLNHKLIKSRIRRDVHHEDDSFGEIFKSITLLVTPFILSTAIYNLSSVVNTQVYQGSYAWRVGVDKDVINDMFGLFSAQAQTISTIPIAFASAMAAAMIPSITTCIASKDITGARSKIALAVKTTMIISIPSAVGIFVLAKPVIFLLFPGTTSDELEIAGRLLMALAVSVVFFAISTLNNSILQGIGRVNTPVVNAAIALAIQSGVLFALLKFTDLDIYSVVIANLVYSAILSFLNQFFVRREIGYRQELLKSILIPTVASAIMGLVAWGMYKGLFLITQSMRISVIPAIIMAIGVYFFALLMLKCFTEEELMAIPKGSIVVKIGRKLGAF